MSETLYSVERRKELLKHMIRQLNAGETVDSVRETLVRLLGTVPYEEVVQVEQELMAEGLPQQEILKLCDVHAQALRGHIEQPADLSVPDGHPLNVFQKENEAITWEVTALDKLFSELDTLTGDAAAGQVFDDIRKHFFALADVDKHYLRKENLLFPFLEQHGVTGPSTVMWGKHDEIREWLKAGSAALKELTAEVTAEDLSAVVDFALRPASNGAAEMVMKEEEILFPMAWEKLDESEWAQVHQQTGDYGYCLIEPKTEWQPTVSLEESDDRGKPGRIRLSTGTMTEKELAAILNTIPFDMTFVDKDDTVRYFTRGKERVFARSKAIIGRKVQHCHPPKSMHIVEKILDDFKAGREESAAFWINLGGKFVHIEYFSLRGDDGEYLGTLEVSQDLTEKRALAGEQRLLTYSSQKTGEGHGQD
ncbi:MAG: DUF438 domain-containing protein [Acidobacteria bacterium]|nr:MAG: DUF438 domain-containing protein [Acidobacteriota bacterium]RLE23611.1 MAG: DUF438 domain-containing protein [Acidobacteriota bacterium]